MDTTEKERIVKKNILELYRENFNIYQTDNEILNINPKQESEFNCTLYYESILDIFLIEEEHLDSITGKVKDTIKKVTELWLTLPNSSATWNWQMCNN